MVSGSISLPCSGYFSPFPHGTRSLSVRQEYSGLPNGLGGFARGSTGPVLLGRRDRQTMRVQVRGPHPLRPGIQPGSPDTWFSATAGRPVGAGARDPATPRAQPPTGITRARFGHHPLSLATTHGISSPTGTKMFHFPAFPPPPYTRSDDGNPAQPRLGSPIRTPSDNNARSPAPRGISQAATSFISS